MGALVTSWRPGRPHRRIGSAPGALGGRPSGHGTQRSDQSGHSDFRLFQLIETAPFRFDERIRR